MTTLVETGEEDPVLAVASFSSELAWAEAGPEISGELVRSQCAQAEAYLVESRWTDLASLLLTHAALVFSKASEKDCECVFSVISNLVTKAESPDEALAIADQVAIKVTADPADKPALRIRILFNLYNVVENPYGRFLIYKKTLDFAVKSDLAVNGKVTDLIVPSFKRMDSFLKEWNIGKTEKRELFLAISNILKDGKGSAKDSSNFLLKYLATFADEDAQTLAEAKDEAKRAILEFIKAPDLFHCDLLELSAVCQLENDPEYASIYRLLEIFLTCRLDAYLQFQSSNPTLLKDHGLIHEDCVSKMRLMSLAGLASKMKEIPYETIKESLRVTDDEVEIWIVKGIASKMLDGKMDQMRQYVVISRCTERVFGPAQWKELRGKLAVWKENIWTVTKSVESAKASNGVPVALQGTVVH